MSDHNDIMVIVISESPKTSLRELRGGYRHPIAPSTRESRKTRFVRLKIGDKLKYPLKKDAKRFRKPVSWANILSACDYHWLTVYFTSLGAVFRLSTAWPPNFALLPVGYCRPRSRSPCNTVTRYLINSTHNR